jgi:hypothetical protein
MRPSLLDRLDGPPLRLPRTLDAVSERWWALTPRLRAVLALLAVGLLVLTLGGRLARPSHGPPVEVAVATRDLPPGHRLEPGDLRPAAWPARLAPTAPLPADSEGVLTGALPEGGVLSAAHLDEGGLGALVGDGRAAVAVPVDLLPEHSPGTVLELVAVDAGDPLTRSTAEGRVLAVVAGHVWVEVGRAAAPGLAAAAHRGELTAVVRPP